MGSPPVGRAVVRDPPRFALRLMWAGGSTRRRGRAWCRNSETSATTTGVAAALISVPVPQIQEAAYAAAADARLAMINVSNETPLPDRSSLRSASGVGDSTPSA